VDSRFDLLLRYSSTSLQRLRLIKNHLLEMDKEDLNGKVSSNPQECGTRIITSSEIEALDTILRSVSDMNDQVRKLLERFV